MLQGSHHALDARLAETLDSVGLVGQRLRESLIHDLKAKIVLRSAADPVGVLGEAGTGKHTVVDAAHAVARDVLGRTGPKVAFDCTTEEDDRAFEVGLKGALGDAAGGTLVIDGFGDASATRQRTATRLVRERRVDALVLTVGGDPAQDARPARTAITLKPLHERDEDIWELVDHFFAATIEDCAADVGDCRGFSRQAKADIAEVVRETNLTSVRRLQDIVRDVIFEALALGPLPLKLTSDEVRPYLEASCGQTEVDRARREAELIESRFDGMVRASLIEKLSDIHEVPPEILRRQAALLEDLVGYIDDVPRSYRNIMDKAEDVQRAALWVVTGASTQAEFRRHFGEERFMRPTKSVAWAFFNRVFKRDM